jgi:hypothetical protein
MQQGCIVLVRAINVGVYQTTIFLKVSQTTNVVYCVLYMVLANPFNDEPPPCVLILYNTLVHHARHPRNPTNCRCGCLFKAVGSEPCEQT